MSSSTSTTIKLPGGRRTLKVTVTKGTIRTQANDNAGYSFVPLPAIIPPPLTDNTLLARAIRSPGYKLQPHDSNPCDATALSDIVYALFTVRQDTENVRLELTDPALQELIEKSGLGVPSPVEPETSLLLLREAFWQGALSPAFIRHPVEHTPLTWTFNAAGQRHPMRQPQAEPGTVIYERWIPHLGRMFSLRLVDPSDEADLRLFSKWQNVRLALCSSKPS